MLSQLNRRVQPEELSHPSARLLSAPGSRRAPRCVPTASPRLRELLELFASQSRVGVQGPPQQLTGTQCGASLQGEELKSVGDA